MNLLMPVLSAVFAAMVSASLVFTAGFLTAARAQTRPAQENSERIKQGHELVENECGRCHAIGRTDASRHPQAPPFRILSKRYPIESLEEALGEGIISGHPDMPEFQFDNEDVGAIIAYLKSIQDK